MISFWIRKISEVSYKTMKATIILNPDFLDHVCRQRTLRLHIGTCHFGQRIDSSWNVSEELRHKRVMNFCLKYIACPEVSFIMSPIFGWNEHFFPLLFTGSPRSRNFHLRSNSRKVAEEYLVDGVVDNLFHRFVEVKIKRLTE